jgi:predicted enzyme related to lactoylglutathione lyase
VHKARAKNVEVVSWQLTTSDGQSLFIKKISRKQQPTQGKLSKSTDGKLDKYENNRKLKDVTRLGIKLPVDNIDSALEFYNRILGLRIARETRSVVNLEGIIALVPKDYEKDSINYEIFEKVRHSIIYIETRNFERVVAAVQESGNRIITPVTQWSGQRFFRCIDPDGNIVEVFDASYKPDKNDV